MKKMTILFLVLALLTSFALVAAQDDNPLHRLRVINKTWSDVGIKLMSDNWFYYVTVPAATFVYDDDGALDEIMEVDHTFTIENDMYDVTFYVCDQAFQGELDMSSNVKLNFPTCGEPPNKGEPTMEKITPPDVAPSFPPPWRFQYAE